MKIKCLFICAALVSAAIFGPAVVSADHTVDHTLRQLQTQLASIQDAINFLFAAQGGIPGKPVDTGKPATTTGPVTPAEPAMSAKPYPGTGIPATSATPAKPAAPSQPQQNSGVSLQTAKHVEPIVPATLLERKATIENVQQKLESLQNQIRDLRSAPAQGVGKPSEHSSVPVIVLIGPNLEKTLQRGLSGEDVKRLQEWLARDRSIYPEGLVTGYFGSATERAVRSFQEKHGIESIGVVGPKTRAALATGGEGGAPTIPAVAPKALLARTLTRGASGDDVKNTQELLNRFPEIYPQGSATGFYGSATENAVKKFQEKLGLTATGGVDDATKKKINELAAAVERRQTPKIATAAPFEISVGTKVTLTGSGFTLENNSLFVKGKTILSGLTSHDGTEIVFAIPADIPCGVGSACPLKIVNSNGISNAKAIKFVELVTPPAPEPLPGPTPPPAPEVKDTTPPLRSEGEPSGTLSADTTSVTISLTTDEKAVCKYSGDSPGASYAQISNTFSDTNSTFHSSSVALAPTGYISYAAQYAFYVRCQDSAGNVNADDYLIWFSVANKPILPTLAMVSPNGGEAYKYGDAVTITWEAKNIASKLVNIRLLKSGALVFNIASNMAQGAESGLFVRSWVIPSTVAIGSDYTIEVSDATNVAVKDTGDGLFKISNLAALQIYGPNGGETAMRGFSALLFWTYSGYYPSSINVHLYKGGIFYRTLASGVAPVGFSGYTFLRDPYPLNSRYAEVPIALDIPDGDDYTLEIVDGADSSIRDRSDAPFRIITIPNSTTFRGRLINALSGVPLANVSFGGYSSNSPINGASYSVKLPQFTTDANGAFSFSTTTDDMVSVLRTKALFASWPSCYDSISSALVRYIDIPRAHIGGWFGSIYPSTSVRRQPTPLTSSVMDLGDIPNWPSATFFLYSDIPVQFSISYGTTGIGGSYFKTVQTSSNVLPLEYDIHVKLTDRAGTVYYSPSLRLPATYGCAPQALSFIGGQFTWEPYVLAGGISYSDSNLVVGTAYTRTLQSPTAGTAPYMWSVLYGVLPPGLALDGTRGVISGTPAAAGVYPLTLRVVDAKGVNAATEWTMTVR